MALRLAVSYIHCAKSLRWKNGNIILFSQLKEGGLLSQSSDNAESADKSDDDSTMAPWISEEEMDLMNSGDESDAEPMSKEML